jgi:hypothetical protein
METKATLPRWIIVWGVLLAAVGAVAGLLGILSPTAFFNDLPAFDRWADIAFVTTGWGVRNLAMAAAMVLVLVLRTPALVAAVFTMRFITEGGDLLNTLATGHGGLGLPTLALVVVWVALFLVPEALAARWGFMHMKAQGQ